MLFIGRRQVHFLNHPKTFSVSSAIRNDYRYNGHRAETKRLISDDFKEAHVHGRSYETYRLWYVFVDEEWPGEYQRWEETDFTQLSHSHFTKYIKKVTTPVSIRFPVL